MKISFPRQVAPRCIGWGRGVKICWFNFYNLHLSEIYFVLKKWIVVETDYCDGVEYTTLKSKAAANLH